MAGNRVADIFDRLTGSVGNIPPRVRAADAVLQSNGINAIVGRHCAAAPAHQNVLRADGFQREDSRSQITTAVGLRIAGVEESETCVAKSVDAAAAGAVVG